MSPGCPGGRNSPQRESFFEKGYFPMTTLQKLLAVTTFFSLSAITTFEPELGRSLADRYTPLNEDADDENNRLETEFTESTPLAVAIQNELNAYDELTAIADDNVDAIDRLFARVESLQAEAQKLKNAA